MEMNEVVPQEAIYFNGFCMTDICGFATVYVINRASTMCWLVTLYCNPDATKVQGIGAFLFRRKQRKKSAHT